MSGTCLAVALLLGLVAAEPAHAATEAELLRRHRPLLVLDAREPSPPVAVGPFRRGARGAPATAAPARVYGHALRDGGRLWLQYWMFYPDNPQDRGLVRSGRHEGDWELVQVALRDDRAPVRATFAQHSWAQACAWQDLRHAGPAPVVYVAHASHASYPRPGVHDRPWPDPNDEARGDGRRVRPPVVVITASRPSWVADEAPWGSSRAAWWNPFEQSSPPGPRFQASGAWPQPGRYHASARRCSAGPPGHPWWAVVALLGLATLLALFTGMRRRASPAC